MERPKGCCQQKSRYQLQIPESHLAHNLGRKNKSVGMIATRQQRPSTKSSEASSRHHQGCLSTAMDSTPSPVAFKTDVPKPFAPRRVAQMATLSQRYPRQQQLAYSTILSRPPATQVYVSKIICNHSRCPFWRHYLKATRYLRG